LLAFIAFTVVLRIDEPNYESFGPHWVVRALEVILLLALIAADPARVVRRAKWLRPIAIVLIGLVIARAVNAFT
jgi:hypothetical protein